MIAGMGWRNTGLAKYVYGDLPGPAATPQVIVTNRKATMEGGQWELKNERVLVRMVGVREIRQWVADGAQLPWNGLGEGGGQ